MSESNQPAAIGGGDLKLPAGEAMSMGQHMLDKGAQMLQPLKPIKKMSQHICTFAIYSHDMSRQIETHHFATRLNQDFLQCAVYDSDDSAARLIGVEYIVSDKIFETLSPDEQKLWHSHAYEIKAGLLINPRVPEIFVKPELRNLAKTYGKFWCTWQTDRGGPVPPWPHCASVSAHNPMCMNSMHQLPRDVLPMGPPALMMSPQAVDKGMVKPELLKKRDEKYNLSREAMKASRVEIPEPEWINPQADYWKQHGKGFSIAVETTEMNKIGPLPFP